LPERRAALEAACAEVGRDPATIEVTVGVFVALPEPGETQEGMDDPDKYLFGSTEEIAAGLRAYEDQGVGHVICWTLPNTSASLRRLTDVLRVYRAATT
jgi:alkanesulfonate monooxygenase SsuD/methylene tetrahydromethanopterin reductase-like flavin-dependent oxidoreductase (luciferase family)